MILFDRVFAGNDETYARAAAGIDAAIEKYGPDMAVSHIAFPVTTL